MQVELDIFSGRPNPHWNLTPQETQKFWELFYGLREGQPGLSIREGLGYRGLIVREVEDSNDRPHEIVICDEVVAARWVSKLQQLRDKGRTLEQWLLQTARGRIDEDIYLEAMSEIEGTGP